MKVLVVDDSLIYRRVVHDLVEAMPRVREVHTARDGHIALRKAKDLVPEVITLDLVMPGLSGLEVLSRLQEAGSKARVIVLSSRTPSGSALAVQALEAGAVAVLQKPTSQEPGEAVEALAKQLGPMLEALDDPVEQAEPWRQALVEPAADYAPRVLVIGASTGGPAALRQILQRLPKELPVPVVAVVHMPKGFTALLANNLDQRCAITVVEARQGESLRPGCVYLAPGGQQLDLVGVPGGGSANVRLTDDPPEHGCRPSVDYLFRAVARAFGGGALAVILTGMGSDGAQGLVGLHALGAHVIAQDRESCVVYGMPGAAVSAGAVNDLLPLKCIADRINELLRLT